jgi:hypothetical protein
LVLRGDLAPRTYAELSGDLAERTIRASLARGELTRLVPDQYCLTLHASSWLMRARAATEWAGPRAAVTGLAAFAIRGYTPAPVDLIQVAVPAGEHRSGPPWIKVRSLTMPFATATWDPGTQVTMPDLAMALGYGTVPPHLRAAFLHGALHADLVTAHDVDDLARRLTRIPAKRELLTRLSAIRRGAESYLEERGMADVFYGPEFEGIVFQHRVQVRGERFRIDAFHLPTLTAFELDGAGTHDKPPDRLRDVRRDALLATQGILTVRLPSDSVFTRPEWCRDVALETITTRS